jgi:hypothetical protein
LAYADTNSTISTKADNLTQQQYPQKQTTSHNNNIHKSRQPHTTISTKADNLTQQLVPQRVVTIQQVVQWRNKLWHTYQGQLRQNPRSFTRTHNATQWYMAACCLPIVNMSMYWRWSCSYLCKQQRIRRQGSSGASWYTSSSDVAMHCDHVALRSHCTNRRCIC